MGNSSTLEAAGASNIQGQTLSSEEALFKLDRHRLTPGGYVTVTEPDGQQRPFRVVAMTPALLVN